MKRFAANLVASVSSNALGNSVCELIRGLLGCTSPEAVASLIGSTSMLVLLPAVTFVGSEILLHRKARKDAAAFDAHCATMLSAIQRLDQNADQKLDVLTDQISDLLEHRVWVHARLSGGDQAALARRINNEVLRKLFDYKLDTDERLDDLAFYGQKIINRLDGIDEKLDALRTDNATLIQLVLQTQQRQENDLRTIIADREGRIANLNAQVAYLTDTVTALRAAADEGNTQADRALRIAEVTGDIGLMLSFQEIIYIARCRSRAIAAEDADELDEAEYWVNEILSLQPANLDAIVRLGNILYGKGDQEGAEARYRSVFEVAPYNARWHGIAFFSLAFLAHDRKDLDTAERYANEAHTIQHKIDNRDGLAVTLNLLGRIALSREAFDTADAHVRKGLSLWRQLGDQRGQANNLLLLGQIAHDRGDLDAAIALFHQAALLYRELGLTSDEASALRLAGSMALLQDQPDAARQWLSESRALYTQLNLTQEVEKTQSFLDHLAAEPSPPADRPATP